jgi:hypothetical protein
MRFLGTTQHVRTACAPDIRPTRVERTVAGLLLLCFGDRQTLPLSCKADD